MTKAGKDAAPPTSTDRDRSYLDQNSPEQRRNVNRAPGRSASGPQRAEDAASRLSDPYPS